MFKPRILHISEDEKFLNAATFIFEKAFPDCNTIIVLKPAAFPPLRYVNKHSTLTFEVISPSLVKKLSALESGYDIIVFHGLHKVMAALFLESSCPEKYLWLFYGAEVYNKDMMIEKFIDTKSRIIYHDLKKITAYDFITQIYRNIRYRRYNRLYENVNFTKALYNIRNVGILIDANINTLIDYKIVNPEINKIPFTFYPLEYIIKDKELYVHDKNILLGNSSSVTNNHLEAIDILSGMFLDDRKVYTPLSYGSKKYAKKIKKYGRFLLGENFVSLDKFLPVHEYNKVISKCGIVIMNHYRPQAIGTIIASLYYGAKVFLNDTSVYKYLKNLGCHIFLIQQDFIKNRNTAFDLLTCEQIEHNRLILLKEFSAEIVANRLRISLDFIYSKSFSK